MVYGFKYTRKGPWAPIARGPWRACAKLALSGMREAIPIPKHWKPQNRTIEDFDINN